MDQSSLTFRAFKNSAYNVIGYLWPVIFTLAVTPIVVFTLGIKEYGIYLFVNTTMGLLGLFDLGLGTAVTKHLSYYYGKGDQPAIKRLIRSANSLFLAVGLLGLGTAAAIAIWGTSILPDRFATYQQYASLFFIGGGIFFLNTISSTASAALVAVQRFDVWNKIGVVSTALMSLSILAVIKAGGSLQAVFLVQLAVTLGVACATFYNARKILPLVSLTFGWDKSEIKTCYTFGLVNFINNIASSALASLDRLIIPLFVGPSNLTYYSMPGNVTAKIPGMSNTLGVSLFPTVSQLSGSEDAQRIETLYIRSFRLITVVAGALTITSISFAHEILRFWLNSDFADKSSSILVILALTNFILALFGPLSNFLLGLGKLKFLTASSLSMAILNLALLFILLPRFGILGAAYAYLFSVLPVIYFFYHVERHYLKLSGRVSHYARTIGGTVLTASIVWCVNLATAKLIISLPTLLLTGGVSALLYILTYKALGFFAKEDWHDLERFYSLILKKIKP